jgi:signal transduction histidine kinase
MTPRQPLGTRLTGRLGLGGIRGQIAALVVAAIVVTHLFITATFLLHRPDAAEPPGEHPHRQLAAMLQLLGAAAPEQRPLLLAETARAFPHLEIKPLDGDDAAAAAAPDGAALRRLRFEIGGSFRVFAIAGQPQQIGIALPDGATIAARLPPERRQGPFWGGPWMTTLLFVVVSLALLGLWAARALSAPLQSFARAAESFSLDGADAPLPERGPEEIRAVARALNRMRERITTLIDDRTRMLAAISHDLRTPITRMRLRSEFIDDESHRTQTLRDLDQMRSMLESVLSFLRNGRKLEAMTLIDLASTLQLIVNQFADTGHRIVYDGPDHAMAVARPDDLHRAVTNLVENAVKFGTMAKVRLRPSPATMTIEVEDDGPGISDARKASMLEPFVRGDDARNMDDASGFGLGLSIAHAIVQAHGGELTLLDRQPHGLIARIDLRANAQGSQAA